MPAAIRYDPSALLAAGYTGERGSFARACRALGWTAVNAQAAKRKADEALAEQPAASSASAVQPTQPIAPRFPHSPTDAYAMHRLVTDEPVGVVSDEHLPYHDATLMTRVARACQARGVGWLIHDGDFFDAPQMHRRGLHSHQERRFDDDLDLGATVAAEYDRWVRRGQVWVKGNHERFVQHRTGSTLREAVLMRQWFHRLVEANRAVVVDAEAMELVQGGRKIVIVHGTSAAQNVLLTMQRYAARWAADIVMGHVHQTALTEWNGYQLACIGGLYDPDRLLYAHEAPRPAPQMVRSWAVIDRGIISVLRANDPTW